MHFNWNVLRTLLYFQAGNNFTQGISEDPEAWMWPKWLQGNDWSVHRHDPRPGKVQSQSPWARQQLFNRITRYSSTLQIAECYNTPCWIERQTSISSLFISFIHTHLQNNTNNGELQSTTLKPTLQTLSTVVIDLGTWDLNEEPLSCNLLELKCTTTKNSLKQV